MTYISDTLNAIALEFATIEFLNGGPQVGGSLVFDKADKYSVSYACSQRYYDTVLTPCHWNLVPFRSTQRQVRVDAQSLSGPITRVRVSPCSQE